MALVALSSPSSWDLVLNLSVLNPSVTVSLYSTNVGIPNPIYTIFLDLNGGLATIVVTGFVGVVPVSIQTAGPVLLPGLVRLDVCNSATPLSAPTLNVYTNGSAIPVASFLLSLPNGNTASFFSVSNPLLLVSNGPSIQPGCVSVPPPVVCCPCIPNYCCFSFSNCCC